MMKMQKNLIYPWIFAAVAALGPCVGAAMPAQAATGQAATVQTGGKRVLNPPVLFMLPYEERPFLEERTALMEALQVAGEDDRAQMRVLIDLAELHFAHGMFTEGLSILAEVKGAKLPPAHRLRAGALELALGLFDPLQRPLTPRAAAYLEPAHSDWPDQPMLLALWHLRAGTCSETTAELRPAFERLRRFPGPARARVLPLMLECAIEDRQWQLARDIAADFAEHPDLRDSAALHFLLGQVAEAGDEPLVAFDSYVLAQGSNDLWGHRARRALVGLGLNHQALGPAEAAGLLALEAEQWRGDAAAAATLVDLAALQELSGDAPAAVVSYGRLLKRHVGTAAADGALEKARVLIADLYEKGATGEISLADFMALHGKIAPHFRFTEGYAEASERFADRFFAAGATLVAAQEYAATRNHLNAAQDLGLFKVPSGVVERLAVKEAEALLQGGQFDALGVLLAQPPKPGDPALAERLALVSARYFDETGQSAALLTDNGTAAPEQVLRLRAQARFERAEWSEAQAAYAALSERAKQSGASLPLPDAIRYLLAAHRSGDSATAKALAGRFAALADLPDWTEIAATLTTPGEELLPLRQDAARRRMDSAQDVLDMLSKPRDVN